MIQPNYKEYLKKCYEICTNLIGDKMTDSKGSVYSYFKRANKKDLDNFAGNLDNLVEEHGIREEFNKQLKEAGF